MTRDGAVAECDLPAWLFLYRLFHTIDFEFRVATRDGAGAECDLPAWLFLYRLFHVPAVRRQESLHLLSPGDGKN